MPCGPDILTAIHLLSANCASLFQSRCTRDGNMVVQSMGWTDRKVKPANQKTKRTEPSKPQATKRTSAKSAAMKAKAMKSQTKAAAMKAKAKTKMAMKSVVTKFTGRPHPESGAILWLAKAQACPLNVLVAWAGPILSKSHQLTRHDSNVIASL